MTMYIFTDWLGETQTVYVCDKCAQRMPRVNGDDVRTYECDSDIACELCVLKGHPIGGTTHRALRNRCDDSAINAGTISQSPVGSDDFCHPTGHKNRATKRNS